MLSWPLAADPVADATSTVTQTTLGALLILALIALVAMWRLFVRLLNAERERADKAEARNTQLEEDVRERFVPLLTDLFRLIPSLTELVRDSTRRRES